MFTCWLCLLNDFSDIPTTFSSSVRLLQWFPSFIFLVCTMAMYIIVDVHFQWIFSRYPIWYTGGTNHRLVNIYFTGMDRDECYVFIVRFTCEKCVKIYCCLLDIKFPKGLRLIRNKADYHDFIYQVHMNVLLNSQFM